MIHNRVEPKDEGGICPDCSVNVDLEPCRCDEEDLSAPREHIERMIEHAKKQLTPKELADAIVEVKKNHPNDFPS